MSYFSPYIDDSGIHMPTYEDRLQDLCTAYRSIFGQEAELDEAVPDYQLLSVFAKALDDTSALVLSAYNSRNPAYASGQALDLLLPQYGIVRQPGETDAEVRGRMDLVTAGRGIFFFDAMEAAIRQVPNVSKVMIRANDENTEVDGIAPHTIAAYVHNGNAGLVAEAIWRKKPPGIGTYGSLSRSVTDEQGNTHTVKFSRPTLLPVSFWIELKSYEGFDADVVAPAIQSAIYHYVIDFMDIGDDLNVPQLYGLLYQAAGEYASTFAVTDMSCSGNHGVSREKVIANWNEMFTIVSTSEVRVIVSS